LACGPELDHGSRGFRKPLRAGEERGTEEYGGADTRGHAARERKEGGRARLRLGGEVAPTRGPGWQREEEREGSARGARLVAGPAHAGREKKRGPEGERERGRGEWAGVAHAEEKRGKGRDGPSQKGLGLLSSFLLFLFPFYTQIIQTKLFEFK
jgi:hypothetical protein